MLQNVPIQRKLTVLILLISGTALLLTCLAFFGYEFLNFRRNTVKQLTTLGQIMATNSTAALAFRNPTDAAEILSALAAEPQIESAALYDRDDALFSSYPRTLAPESFPARAGQVGPRFDGSSLHTFLPVVQGQTTLGMLYLRMDLRAIHARFWIYGGTAALILIGALLLAYFLSRGLQTQISRPILALADTAHTVSNNRDYSVRATKFGSDELGVLTDAFNHMLAQIERLNRDLESRVVERTAQLESANRELEAFSYSVSHDLRAPLRHIDGFVNLLTKQHAGQLDEQGQRYLRVISSSARQMGRLIDDLLEFSRTGRAPLKIAEVDHDALIATIVRNGRYDQASRPIAWKIAPLPRVQADEPMLGQVWANLIGNAVKYSSKSAAPTVEVGTIEPAAGAREQVFFVRDNGVGFDMAYAGKLFGVFQRLHTSEEFEGTGIGLANVQRIVSRHGGRVWAEGAVGRGATFFFTLPIHTLAPSRQVESPRVASSASNFPFAATSLTR